MTAIREDRASDAFKGLLTLLMVYCHVLQFFGDAQLSPPVRFWMELANLSVFPGFVFVYGRNLARSSLQRPWRQAAPRLLGSALRLYGAFFISGLAFRVLRENKPLASGTVRNILLLNDIPGWSEFIIAFSLYALLALALFRPLRYLAGKPLLAVVAMALCLLASFLPYQHFLDPRLSLFIGGTRFAYFPVLQYAPYFLGGILYQSRPGKRCLWLLAAMLLFSLGLTRVGFPGFVLPERFSPDIGWLLLGTLPVALLRLLSEGITRLLARVPSQLRFLSDRLLGVLCNLGRNSLFYLLASNLVLFTLAGKGISPWLKVKAPGIFGEPIQTAAGAFWWMLALLALCALLAGWVRPAARRPREKRE